MKVSIEGTEFIDESRCYHIEKKTDKLDRFYHTVPGLILRM